MNLVIEKMLKKYKATSRIEYERALKEVIQQIALVALWRARFFEHAAFYGGTALRIFHGINRFSEDLDFTLFKVDDAFSLENYNQSIREELLSYGFSVTVDIKTKSWKTPIRSAFIKTDTLGEMLKVGVPSDLLKGVHPNALLKIKLEVDTHPPLTYKEETHFLTNPIGVAVRTVTLEDILIGKIHALLFRKWKGRVKGRDWYDWLYLTSHNVPLNLSRLGILIRDTDALKEGEKLNRKTFKELMNQKIESLDLDSAIRDILPFAEDRAVIGEWSKKMFHDFTEKMQLIE